MKPSHSLTGAPSQHNQSSRKGKRAWRKNVDIQDVEEAMEGMRAEERVTGTTLQKIADKDLFEIDVQGDPQTRKSLPRFSSSLLTSTKILSQRSAVPAVFSRSSHSSITKAAKRKTTLTPTEKDRLLRISKRPRKGPFNSHIDPSQPGEGSALAELSEAVKHSGAYDPWASQDVEMPIDLGMDTVTKKIITKPPLAPLTKSLITASLPAVPLPHQGASYNPPVDAHQDLLRLAHSLEEKRLKEAEKGAHVKEKMQSAGVVGGGGGGGVVSREGVDGAPPGMLIDTVGNGDEDEDEDDENEEGEGEAALVKKMPPRKTKAQRNKAARLLAEKRTHTHNLTHKHLLASIPASKRLGLAQSRATLLRTQRLAAKRAQALERLHASGLAGHKLGKHRVPAERVDVQLGEDLSESLRGLKTEGNLFRERWVRMMQRGVVEPRVPVLPRKRKTKMVEYEKHAWKRFE